MVSVREALFFSGKLEFESPWEVEKLLESDSSERDESLILYFGTCDERGVSVKHAEHLPESCYLERAPKYMDFDYEKCHRCFSEREKEVGMKLVGTGHLHKKDLDVASVPDKANLSRLGVDLFHAVHHVSDIDPRAAYIYAVPDSEYSRKRPWLDWFRPGCVRERHI